LTVTQLDLLVAAGSSSGRIPFPETGNPIWPFHQLCLLLRSTAPLTAKLDFFTLRRRGRPGGKPAKVVHTLTKKHKRKIYDFLFMVNS
jgi:hypothetical protein